MALNNYGDLKVAVQDFLSRVDLEQRAPDFIALGISTLNKVLRSRRMIVNADVSIASNVRKGPIPQDLLEPVYAQIKTNEDYPLTLVDVAKLVELRQSLLRDQGTPRFYALVGGSMEVAATPPTAILIDLASFQAIPAFTDDASTNWVLTYEPDIMLYASLLHAAPLLKDADRLAIFSNVLTKQIITALQTNGRVTLDDTAGGVIAALAAPAQQ
jgi:hypothetical protein